MHSVMKLPQTWKDGVLAIQPNYHINAISKCGIDAYVDTKDKVERVKLKLLTEMQNSKDIVTSKSTYHTVYEVWKFTNLPWSASVMFMRLKSLFHSGIVTLWRLWKYRVETYNDTINAARSTGEKFKALSLSDSNMVVVFYVHMSALGFLTVVFLMENWTQIVTFCKLLDEKVRNLAKLCKFLVAYWICSLNVGKSCRNETKRHFKKKTTVINVRNSTL